MPPSETTVRDDLALRRTTLANERTLLAYVRTALMLVASGATLWRFAPMSGIDRAVGIAAMAVGGVVLVIGAARYAKQRRELGE